MYSRRTLAGRLALESLVIVASILAAFALDTWWEGTKEREEEAQALQALHGEFTQARESIEFYRSIQGRILQSVASVADSLNRALMRGDRTVVVPDTALAWAYIPPTTTVSLGTLESLASSGRLGIIRDQQLRAALASWGVELAELTEEETDSRNLTYGAMDEIFRKRINTYGLWGLGNRLFQEELSDSELQAVREIPVDTEILGVFYLRESLLVHGVDEFEPLLARVDTILSLIEKSS